MKGRLIPAFCAAICSLILAGQPVAAQLDWPVPPANWWTDLDDGGFPSATFEINMGMSMSITQSIESVVGTQITVATAVSMMGNAMPAQTQVMDAATMTPEGGIAMLQGMGGPPDPDAPSPEEALAALDPMVERIEDTTCLVGTLELECTLWEVAIEGMTSRVWIGIGEDRRSRSFPSHTTRHAGSHLAVR